MPLNLDSFIFSKLSESSNVSSFICSEYSDLEEFLKDDAKNYHREKIATTYLVHSDDALIGYYSIAMGCVVSEQVQNMIGEIRFTPKRFPALLLAKMATQDGLRGQGVGQEMLARVFSTAFRLCPHIGCRFIKVDAKNNPRTIHFYEKYGQFKKIPIGEGGDTIPMIVDLNKVCRDDTRTARLIDFN